MTPASAEYAETAYNPAMPGAPRYVASFAVIAAAVATIPLNSQTPAQRAASAPRIIDMHMHARTAAFYGPPPLTMCAPVERMPRWDQRKPMWQDGSPPPCNTPMMSPMTDDDLLHQTVEIMERHNIVGVLGGSPELVAEWMKAAPGRFIPALDVRFEAQGPETAEMFAPMPPGAPRRVLTGDEIRRLHAAGAFRVLGEVANQYAGIAPDDERLEPLWAMAEELDIPVGIHIGGAEPGTPFTGVLLSRQDDGIVVVSEVVGNGASCFVLRAVRKEDTMDGGDDRFERRLVEETAKLRVEVAGVEVRLTDRIAQSEGTLRQEIHGLDVRMERGMGALRADFGAVRSDVVKWAFAFWLGQVVAIGAIMSALLR